MKTQSIPAQNCAAALQAWTTRLLLLLLSMAFLSANAGAQPTICNNQVLPAGNGGDLLVTGMCTVDGTAPSGTYLYKNVNIISTGTSNGTLLFQDAVINFWAESILVENNGSLLAGTPGTPIGTAGGQLTIHLYGKDQGTGSGSSGGQGIVCKTPVSSTVGPCGVPSSIWNSNTMSMTDPTSCTQSSLPGTVTDCFYQYMPLDYDGGGPPYGYFGYKVLAVSYGGTLQLFGKKGATYHTVKPSTSSTSWARLNSNVTTGGTSLVLDRSVDWQAGDQIVLSTTDYLPGHSEQLTIASVSTSNGVSTITTTAGAAYAHNGTTYDLKAVPSGTGPDQDPNVICSGTQTRCVETRAAVGLLTRSIQIVSGGDTLQSPFPGYSSCMSGTPPTCSSSAGDCYYFGGHTLVRQGFNKFQVQGVEFYQLGQGGRIMHYPVHFHMARQTPSATFVKDSSVWDSMTRWYTIHATQGVTLARNVGYLSIGHGYYFEDGTETNNLLSANLGVFARAAVVNDQNPRCVPGILAEPYQVDGFDQIPFSTDSDHPTAYWMTNGWNDFQYNVAAGTGMCGMCYWLTPAGNSGASRSEYWTSYSAEQLVTQPNNGGDVWTRAGTTPLKSFVGNSCVSSQNAFITIGQTSPCFGVVANADAGAPQVKQVPNPLAPIPSDSNYDSYYPKVNPGGSRQATRCPAGTDCSCSDPTGASCPNKMPGVPVCAAGSMQDCMVTQLNHFTTSFTWAQTNVSAMWLRPQWYLVSNSAITDVQNGGLTMVSGGGYTNSDQIPGYWALALKNVFVGSTQPSNPYALNAGPFNPMSLQSDPTLTCALRTDNNMPDGQFCLNVNQGIAMSLDAFAVNQRLFNIYDGPSFQDSNAFLDITPTTLTNCAPTSGGGGGAACQSMGWMYGNTNGVPLDPVSTTYQPYLPNAAIAWKQPNGFFYPPAFHSSNLFFNNVGIQHFVIEPLFNPGTYDTDGSLAATRYFNDAGGASGVGGMFNGFTDIDRQTELSDDDGSLTGLLGAPIPHTSLHRPAISVNKDPFFSAPVQTVECASDLLDNMPQPWGTCNLPEPLCGTANTSPYDYVTAVVYPSNTDGNGSCAPQPNWAVDCTGPNCYGVPLIRQDLVPSDDNSAPFIRMASQADCQRSSLTVNNGTYYIDTAVSLATQNMWDFTPPGVNVFTAGNTYYTFLLFAKPTTVQTYQLYVGTGFNPADTSQLWVTRVDKGPSPFVFYKDTTDTMVPCSARKPGTNFGWCYNYDASGGFLSVTMDMGFSTFAKEYAEATEQQCQPESFCSWNSSSKSCGCSLKSNDLGYNECQYACSNWATKAIDCPWDSSDFPTGPTGACYGFGFTLPGTFMAADQAPPGATCLTEDLTWNVPLTAASSTVAGNCAYTQSMLPTGSFCTSGKKR